MAFFRRVFSHFLQNVLVEGLANSKTFQRFAVWSDKAIKDAVVKGQEHGKVLDQHLNRFTEVAKEKSSQLRKDFEQELKKVQQQQQQQQQQKPPLR